MSKISDTTNKIAELKKDIAELELSLNDELKQSFQNFDVTTDGASGNAGDWAEIYVFYRVMEQGKIKTAKDDNGNMSVVYDAFLPVLKIIREESGLPLEYYTSNEANGARALKIYYAGLDEPLVSCNINDFKTKADELLNQLKSAQKTSSLSLPDQASFLNDIFIRKIKSPSKQISKSFGGKSDITMEIIQQDNLHVPAGFSIKSSIKSKSSLINASKANDVIYEVIGCTDDIMDEVNSIDSSSWVIDRTKRILNDDSLTIRFDHFGSNTFHNNLSLIADREPEVIAYAVLYSNGDPEVGHGSNRGVSDVLQSLIVKEPVGVGQEVAPLYYQKRLKDFLFEFACGMQSDTPWDTDTKIQGGYIFVTKEGDVLAYYASDQDSYKNWLINGTRFDMPSTSRHTTENRASCGCIHKENGKYYYTLSTQVKFKK